MTPEELERWLCKVEQLESLRREPNGKRIADAVRALQAKAGRLEELRTVDAATIKHQRNRAEQAEAKCARLRKVVKAAAPFRALAEEMERLELRFGFCLVSLNNEGRVGELSRDAFQKLLAALREHEGGGDGCG